MYLEAPTAPAVLRQGHSYLSKENNGKLLAHLKDTEMEELGSTERCSAISLGNFFSSKKLLLSHGAPEIAQCDPQGLLSLGGIQ